MQRPAYIGEVLDLISPKHFAPAAAQPANDVVERAQAVMARNAVGVDELPVPERAPMALRILHRVGLGGKQAFARYVYRPNLLKGRKVMAHVGAFGNAYTGHSPEEFARKWMALERLHRDGRFGGAWGEAIGDGAPLVMTKLLASRSVVQEQLHTQVKEIGRDLILPDGTFVPIKKATMGLMLGTSGMSFPQLSAPSILSLCYANVKLAQKGVRFMFNTGEGGPDLHLAFMAGDAEGLRRQVIAWGHKTGEIPEGSSKHAKVEEYVARLMKERDELFKEFTPEDLAKAQIVAQFGSALNGIHDEEGRIDFAKLKKVGESPFVAMTEFKLKQASKRGSKVDPKKMDDTAASIRQVIPGQVFKSPAIHPELGSYEDIAALVIAAKLTTGKPVSLKFAIGDVDNIYEFLEYLASHDALPDHIQIDGAGKHISPGSGNTAPTGTAGDGNVGMRDAVIIIDSVLKHLGVRDEVHIASAGEVILPTDGIEAMQLGADSVLGARTWLGMGLGCAKVGACDTGSCPYGIASKSGSVFADSLDPRTVGPKAVAAALDWQDHFLKMMMETGTMDWRSLRKTHGLHARAVSMRVTEGDMRTSLQKKYGRERTYDLLDSILRPEEIDKVIYQYNPPEYVAYERFDATRRLLHFLEPRLSKKPEDAAEVDAYVQQRMKELMEYLQERRTGPEIRDSIREEIPAHLRAPGTRMLASDAARGWSNPQLRVWSDPSV